MPRPGWDSKLLAKAITCSPPSTMLEQGEQPVDEWFTEGNTLLIPKSEETHLPNNYRPIICLPPTYKLLTGIITDATYNHLTQQGAIKAEHKGCKRDVMEQ